MLGYESPFERAFGGHLYGWDDVFRNFERAFRLSDGGPSADWNTGPVRLADEGEHYVLTAELPGLTEKDVSVDFHDGVLTIGAERQVAAPEGYDAHRRERRALKLSRSWRLGDGIDAEHATAEMKDGVLTVRLAKAAQAKPRQIPVRSN